MFRWAGSELIGYSQILRDKGLMKTEVLLTYLLPKFGVAPLVMVGVI
jgi:hypothetical protein